MKLTTSLALFALISVSISASADDEKPSPAERAKALVATWSWPANGASATQSLPVAQKAAPNFKLELDGTKLAVLADGGARWTLDLPHPASDYRVVGDLLILARYHRMSSGCSLEAYSLVGGAKRWTCNLQGLGPIAHSKYFNTVALVAQADLLVVRGKESQGKYTEVVDPKTGKTIAHKRH